MTSLMTQHEKRFFIMYHDVERVCRGDVAGACILRMYEDKNDARARELIKAHKIPDGVFPHPDDLWIDEADLRSSEAWTAGIRCKSTYPRVLADVSPNPRKPSLIQLGFLQRRFIARPLDDLWMSEEVPTTLYRDERGIFIVVQNANGFYVGDDDSLRCARSQGFYIVKQYRYEADVVNAALAKSAWREPPEPLKRWGPIVQRRQGSAATAAQKTTILSTANSDATANESQGIHNDARRAGTSRTTSSREVMHSFASEHNIAPSALSREFDEKLMRIEEPVRPLHRQAHLYRDTLNADVLRCAPWCPETIIALSSHILAIPARPSDDDEEALRHWLIDWYAPAVWLIAATKDVDPRYAWEKIQRHIRGMISGPTWHARQRSHPSPITLRHVVGWNKKTGELNGHNWGSVRNQLNDAQWWPEEIIAYDGPPLEIKEDEVSTLPPVPATRAEVVEVPDGMVTAITEVNDQAPEDSDEPCSAGLDQAEAMQGDQEAPERDEEQREEPTTDEVIAVPALPTRKRRKPGMSAARAEELARRMVEECPILIIEGFGEIAPDRWVIGARYGPGDAEIVNVDSVEAWYAPPPELQQRISQALLYAASLDGGGTSPPQVESEEEHDAHHEDLPDHQGGGIQAAMPGGVSTG